jgi:hypothetical protein
MFNSPQFLPEGNALETSRAPRIGIGNSELNICQMRPSLRPLDVI